MAAEAEELSHHKDIEEQTLEQLVLLENEFREFDVKMKNELKKQQNLIDRMEKLSESYIEVTNRNDDSDIKSHPTTDCVVKQMAEVIKLLKISNCKLFMDLKEVKKCCACFEDLCSRLDMNSSSPFIKGDTFHKPISFYKEFIGDVFKYFYAWTSKLKHMAHLLEPTNLTAIKNYREAIKLSEDFEEYLNVGLTYCKCRKSNKTIST